MHARYNTEQFLAKSLFIITVFLAWLYRASLFDVSTDRSACLCVVFDPRRKDQKYSV